MGNEIGCFIIDLAGAELTSEEAELVAHPLVGGVILFARNYESRPQLNALCKKLRASRTKPLLIMVDQEGGRVQRFINDFTRIPNMGLLGELYEQKPQAALKLAHDCAWLLASELLSEQVDLSLAPVLDLNKVKNSVIGNRAFHEKPQVVTELAYAFIEGMKEAGMASVGKHFPGHGSVSLDSHVALPIDQRSFAQIEQDDLQPFASLIKQGLPAIMAAHIVYPEIDKVAVSFSPTWLQTILRMQLGFTGVIFSDDLNMEGANISNDYAARVTAAREAGCDFALLCNNRAGVIQVLDSLPYSVHYVGKEKWSSLQGKFSNTLYSTSPRWQEIRNQLSNTIQNIN